MDGNRLRRSFQALLLVLLAEFSSSTTSIPDGASDSHGPIGRSLLQVAIQCPVDFQAFNNYTIITDKCKAPAYRKEPCCDGLLEFACPFPDQVNNLSTTCAVVMFNYIDIHGNYTPGLFSNMCTGDKDGLPCPSNYLKREDPIGNAGHWVPRPSPIHVFLAGFLLAFVLF